MNQTSRLRRILAVGISLVALAVALPAMAASITINDANCDSFGLETDPVTKAQTLTCVVSSPPSCTISAAATALVGTSINLTANCSGSPTSYRWTGGACTAGRICADTQTTAGDVFYTVTGTNNVGAGAASAPSTRVAWSSTPTKPSGCTLTPSPGSPVDPNTVVALTVTCAGGDPPTSYAWTSTAGSIPTPTTANVQSVTVTAAGTYTAVASNAGGSASASTNIALTTTTGAISCSGYTATKVIDAVVPAPGASKVYKTNFAIYSNGASAGFGPQHAVVMRFTAPLSDSAFTISIVNSSGSFTSSGYAVVSDTPCDFTIPSTQNLVATRRNYIVETFSAGTAVGTFNGLVGGKTYYLNLNHKSSTGAWACTTAPCDMQITIANAAY